MKEKTLYSWKTDEFEEFPKQPSWYVGLGIIFLSVAFILIYYFDNYLAALVVVLGLIAMYVHGSHEPKTIKCEITDKKIKIGTRKYPYSKLKSFWIYKEGLIPKIYFQTTDLLFNVLSIPLGEGDSDKIEGSLRDLLPNKNEGEAISDKLARWFKF
jgi:hypothetical protein